MAPQQHFTLGKTERLKSRKRIDQLFKEGKAFSVSPLRVLYTFPPNAPSSLQAGFSASSRNFKKAVDRNRIKRLTREAYRLKKNELEQVLTVNKTNLTLFLIYTGKVLPEYTLMEEKMQVVINKLIMAVYEQNPPNT
ncbi:MAG: ribonuclease P protein component [Chitinophagaceae bacterium]|nr:ribonuclease P protein component [Chitinophagaceae bacterium]